MKSEKNADMILEELYSKAKINLKNKFIPDSVILKKIDYVARSSTNRAAIRFFMSCLLAKIHQPNIDIRKPYTEIKEDDAFSGRTYDEKYLSSFINRYNLPCNSTTAFLTPALRNINKTLTLDVELIGRPRDIYQNILFLLDVVNKRKITAETMLLESIRILILLKNEKNKRLEILMSDLKDSQDKKYLSVEDIINLLNQHLACKRSSRLCVLIIAAAYKSSEKYLKQKALSLKHHNAADKQTKSVGDVEITLTDDTNVVTCYEMKNKKLTEEDIHIVLDKIKSSPTIDNYIFITTEVISENVKKAAQKSYDLIGVEIAILDCIGFIKHFLYLFYQIRMEFLNEYQNLVLTEPDSAVSQELKEVFITLRKSSEAE